MRLAFSKGAGPTFLSFAMCGASALTTWRESICSRVGSHVSPTVQPESGKVPPTIVTSGLSSSESFASFGPDGSWLKMSQDYYQVMMDGSLEPFLGTWPRSGTMRNGNAFRRRPLVRRIFGTGSTSWPTPTVHGMEGRNTRYAQGGTPLSAAVRMWPTPNATDGEKAPKTFGRGNPSLPMAATIAEMYPTPTASDATGGPAYSKPPSREGGFSLKEITPGPLNPMWVEWLMGFPLGWTDLED